MVGPSVAGGRDCVPRLCGAGAGMASLELSRFISRRDRCVPSRLRVLNRRLGLRWDTFMYSTLLPLNSCTPYYRDEIYFHA